MLTAQFTIPPTPCTASQFFLLAEETRKLLGYLPWNLNHHCLPVSELLPVSVKKQHFVFFFRFFFLFECIPFVCFISAVHYSNYIIYVYYTILPLLLCVCVYMLSLIAVIT
jgi:hypothetical protein